MHQNAFEKEKYYNCLQLFQFLDVCLWYNIVIIVNNKSVVDAFGRVQDCLCFLVVQMRAASRRHSLRQAKCMMRLECCTRNRWVVKFLDVMPFLSMYSCSVCSRRRFQQWSIRYILAFIFWPYAVVVVAGGGVVVFVLLWSSFSFLLLLLLVKIFTSSLACPLSFHPVFLSRRTTFFRCWMSFASTWASCRHIRISLTFTR